MSQSNGSSGGELNLKLTIPEVNLILDALGQLPFVRVFALVGKLQQQAQQQLEDKPQEAADAT